MAPVNENVVEDECFDEDGDEFKTQGWYLSSSDIIITREHLWIDGVHISPFDCPGCLDDNEIDDEIIDDESPDCFLCEFFSPEDCIFLYHEEFRDELKILFDIYRQYNKDRYKEYVENRESLVQALTKELEAHGRPLHYTLLAEIVRDRYRTLRVTDKIILKIMAHRPALFEKVSEGVYRLRKY
jgi:uncharacterized protein YcgL (UPF0745 family)